MVRDLPSDVEPFVRDVLAAYRLGRPLPLPQQCTSLPALYRTVVQEVRYIRRLDGSDEVGGRADVMLCSAAPGHQLSSFSLARSVEWVGFAPNPGITSIGDVDFDYPSVWVVDFRGLPNVNTIGENFLYGCGYLTTLHLFAPLSNITGVGSGFLRSCSSLMTIDLGSLSNVTAVGDNFLRDCRGLTTIDLSPLSNVTTAGYHFLSRKGWLRGATFLQKTGAKPVPGASAGGG